MEVIAVADYFSLGNRNSAYLNIAPQVAKLNHEFLEFMLKHLRYFFNLIFQYLF